MALRVLLLTALLAGEALPVPAKAQQDRPPRAEAGKDRKKKANASGMRPMPTDAQLEARKKEAESLPLFSATEPLPFALIANFKTVFRDRDTLSTRRYPAKLVVASAAGRSDTLDVQLRTRGHYRLAKCSFVPLRIEFPKKGRKGTPFADVSDLKLGTHCSGDDTMEQYVLREYQAYRVYQVVSPVAFRARLAKAMYIDASSNKVLDSRFALFIESEEHMAARAGGIVQDARGALFDDVDQTALQQMALFEYMIGNTDWSMYSLHNVRLVQVPGALLPVPYDFDFSGLVDTRYATPDPKLPIKRVKDRLYRGPCKTAEEWAPVLNEFRSSRTRVLALYDSLPALDPGYARDAKGYLSEFYRTLDRPRDVASELITGCDRKGAD